MNNGITILFSGTDTIHDLKTRILKLRKINSYYMNGLVNHDGFIVQSNASDLPYNPKWLSVTSCQGEFLPKVLEMKDTEY